MGNAEPIPAIFFRTARNGTGPYPSMQITKACSLNAFGAPGKGTFSSPTMCSTPTIALGTFGTPFDVAAGPTPVGFALARRLGTFQASWFFTRFASNKTSIFIHKGIGPGFQGFFGFLGRIRRFGPGHRFVRSGAQERVGRRQGMNVRKTVEKGFGGSWGIDQCIFMGRRERV